MRPKKIDQWENCVCLGQLLNVAVWTYTKPGGQVQQCTILVFESEQSKCITGVKNAHSKGLMFGAEWQI